MTCLNMVNGYATNSRHRHHIHIHVIYMKYVPYGLIHVVNIQESLRGSFTVLYTVYSKYF